MTRLCRRGVSPRIQWQLEQQGVHPLLARIYAGRGIVLRSELDYEFSSLLPPARLTHAAAAAVLLADAIAGQQRILIIADYDCDGATACALGIRALRAFGAEVDYLVPNRFTYGYGLSPDIVELAATKKPNLIVTVDNGIASVDGVARARQLGIATLITDHHLPGDELPAADCIVNPNLPGCTFPSKHLAGVGVIFYVLLALRAELRERNWFSLSNGRSEPKLAALLDLVALGTVADVVRLDHNNRVLVSQGLKRIRQGQLNPGLRALFRAAGRNPEKASGNDLGFLIGPRVNAAGRLADMSLGIECLITDDEGRALNIAQQLDALNRERREIESGMQEQALLQIARAAPDLDDAAAASAVSLFDADWHQGVVGIVAARIKERLHRPVFAFARGGGGEIKGSGRSIAGLHLRDALDLLSKRAPGLLLRFGGHAMAGRVRRREPAHPQGQTPQAAPAQGNTKPRRDPVQLRTGTRQHHSCRLPAGNQRLQRRPDAAIDDRTYRKPFALNGLTSKPFSACFLCISSASHGLCKGKTDGLDEPLHALRTSRSRSTESGKSKS
jgi:single-stranded-DNA-specific exonuclease